MMPVMRTISCTSRAQWLAARAEDVTASQVAALFGDHPFITRYQLWHEKAGTLQAPTAETDAMRRGRLFEPVAVEMLREDRPDWDIEYSTAEMAYYRDPDLRLGATPDLIVTHPERGRGVVQIKTVSAADYATKWRDDDGAEEPPFWIALQAEVERHVTGGSWAAVAPLVIGSRFDVTLPILEVPQVDGLIDRLGRAALAFWASIDAGQEPEPDYVSDAGAIAERYADEDPEGALDLTSDGAIDALLTSRAEWLDLRRQANAGINRIDAEIKHRMGDAPVAYLAGGRRIEWRQERRAGRYIGPSDRRRLRLPRAPA